MERFIVSAIIVTALFFNNLPFIHGLMATPKESVFLGTVHFPGDYFYYLSQMVQGKYHFFSSTMLYTAEKLPLTLIGWQNVLPGRIFSFFGLNAIIAYQLTMMISLTVFLYLVYRLLLLVFPKNRTKRLLAFFFFVFSTSLPNITFAAKGWQWSYFNYWYNPGNIDARLGHTPHHAIANCLAVFSIILFVYFFERKNKKIIRWIITLGLCSLLLASIAPIHLGLIGGALLPALVVYAFLKYPQKNILFSFLPFIIFLLFGIPSALYAKQVFSISPYNQSQIWEATQQLRMSLPMLIRGSGLIIIFSFLGVYPFIKRISFIRLYGIIFILFCALFYFTQIPFKLHYTNARFWPSTVYIFLGVLASEGIFFIACMAKRYAKIVLVLILLIYFFTLLPTYLVQGKEILSSNKDDMLYYLPKEAYEGYLFAEKISKPDELFLLEYPYNWSFPAITARKSFSGFYLLTIDPGTKEKEAGDFFSGKIGEAEMEKMLNKYKIKYVVGFPGKTMLDKNRLLERVFANKAMTIDKVVYR